jgi:hypothetical protein
VVTEESVEHAIEGIDLPIFQQNNYTADDLRRHIHDMPAKPDGWQEVAPIAKQLNPVEIGRLMKKWLVPKGDQVSTWGWLALF